MFNARDLLDMARRHVNRFLDLDVVRVSGQHTLRTHMVAILRKYEIDAIIDVGANEGGFGAGIRAEGFQGDIFSFEPVAEVFKVLASRASNDQKWHVFDFALGSEPGVAEINVSKFSQYSSMLSANEYGNSWADMEVDSRQLIVVKTLDQCFRDGSVHKNKRYLLKMDTQGFDLEVFKGANASLPDIRCILSELSLIAIYDGMPSYLEALAAYNLEGYSASGFYPITKHPSLALNEVDCMLVRRASLVGPGDSVDHQRVAKP